MVLRDIFFCKLSNMQQKIKHFFQATENVVITNLESLMLLLYSLYLKRHGSCKRELSLNFDR